MHDDLVSKTQRRAARANSSFATLGWRGIPQRAPDAFRLARYEQIDVVERLGPFDLVMLEVGAFHPAWGHMHLGPENALKALALLGGGPFLPIHWGTFNLAMHAWDQPAEFLLESAPKLNTQLLMPRLGEPIEPALDRRIDPWWRSVDAIATSRWLPKLWRSSAEAIDSLNQPADVSIREGK